MMHKPDVDLIEGLSPALSIEQKTTSKNPRSTVGTVTEIYDYMRLLWARIGIPYSPATGLPIVSQTVSQMVDKIIEFNEGSRFNLLAPIVRDRKGEYRKEFQTLSQKGFQRFRVNNEFYEIDNLPKLDRFKKHNIEVLVDRFVIKKSKLLLIGNLLFFNIKFKNSNASSRRLHHSFDLNLTYLLSILSSTSL